MGYNGSPYIRKDSGHVDICDKKNNCFAANGWGLIVIIVYTSQSQKGFLGISYPESAAIITLYTHPAVIYDISSQYSTSSVCLVVIEAADLATHSRSQMALKVIEQVNSVSFVHESGNTESR